VNQSLRIYFSPPVPAHLKRGAGRKPEKGSQTTIKSEMNVSENVKTKKRKVKKASKELWAGWGERTYPTPSTKKGRRRGVGATEERQKMCPVRRKQELYNHREKRLKVQTSDSKNTGARLLTFLQNQSYFSAGGRPLKQRSNSKKISAKGKNQKNRQPPKTESHQESSRVQPVRERHRPP